VPPTTLAAHHLEVPTALVVFQLEIRMTSVASSCSGWVARVESTIEAARTHHMEVSTASAALQLQVPTIQAT
jgi:hypothetical protein